MNLVTVISPIFVIVMGAADGLHYSSHFMDNMKKYSDRRQLTVETMGMVGMPIFLTTITTMAGFASLTWTEVVPMRQMGIFVSLGIGYAGVLSLFFLPALLSRVKLPPTPPVAQEGRLAGLLQRSRPASHRQGRPKRSLSLRRRKEVQGVPREGGILLPRKARPDGGQEAPAGTPGATEEARRPLVQAVAPPFLSSRERCPDAEVWRLRSRVDGRVNPCHGGAGCVRRQPGLDRRSGRVRPQAAHRTGFA